MNMIQQRGKVNVALVGLVKENFWRDVMEWMSRVRSEGAAFLRNL